MYAFLAWTGASLLFTYSLLINLIVSQTSGRYGIVSCSLFCSVFIFTVCCHVSDPEVLFPLGMISKQVKCVTVVCIIDHLSLYSSMYPCVAPYNGCTRQG